MHLGRDLVIEEFVVGAHGARMKAQFGVGVTRDEGWGIFSWKTRPG